MTEQDKVGHLLKGIAEDVFNFVAQKNVGTVKEFVQECNRFQELKRTRITPQFSRLANVPSVAALRDVADVPTFVPSLQDDRSFPADIQQLIRQEVRRTLAMMNIRPPSVTPSFEDIVRDEVSSLLTPSPRSPAFPLPPPHPTSTEVAL